MDCHFQFLYKLLYEIADYGLRSPKEKINQSHDCTFTYKSDASRNIFGLLQFIYSPKSE